MNDIDILLDIYRDDPETAIAMAQQDSLLSDLFLGQVSHLESGASEIGWNYLIMMVLGLPGHYRHNAFKRLLQLSQQFQAQPELLEELVAARENSQVIDRHENMFAPLFINMKKSELELITSWPLALHVYLMHNLGRFMESGDHKRAFDLMVQAIRMECHAYGATVEKPFWLPETPTPQSQCTLIAMHMRAIAHYRPLATYIDMVWRAHRQDGLVPAVSEDPEAWENTARHLQFSYGQNCKGSKPQILDKNGHLPMAWLWGAYADVGKISDLECPASRAELGGDGYYRNRKWYPVRAPGNKLRLLIRYHVTRERTKKLQRFCDKHRLEMPTM